jgi:hypothetical protein
MRGGLNPSDAARLAKDVIERFAQAPGAASDEQ